MLTVERISKQYEGRPLLQRVSLNVSAGETVCLLGASGSGKSTLLRIIAGLETPEEGRVLWNGEDLTNVPVHHRRFGLMFQDYALFPHRSVAENVAFGLRMQNLPRAEIAQRCAEALEQVNLTAFAQRRVTDLSGGEQQRVALARALAPRPRLLMLDEPLGALDRALKEQLLKELRALLHHTQIPAIYVTHDQEEAFSLADRIALLHEGQIIQAGAPAAVFNAPDSAWVARFLGLGNLLEGRVMSDDPMRVHTALGVWEIAAQSNPAALRGAVTVLLRPDVFRVSGDGLNVLRATVRDVTFHGRVFQVVLEAQGISLRAEMEAPPVVGEIITVSLRPGDIQLLPDE